MLSGATVLSQSGTTMFLTPCNVTGIPGSEFASIVCVPTGIAALTAHIAGTTLTATVNSGSLSPIDTIQPVIDGVGVAAGTQIVNQLTGSAGGTGTYSVNISQTVGSSGSPISMEGVFYYPTYLSETGVTLFFTGSGIPNGTVVSGVAVSGSNYVVTMSQGATATGTQQIVFGPGPGGGAMVLPWYGGLYNYLLKRDLDPASNDNSPLFVRKAA